MIFSVGDHVYHWCSIAGMKKSYSHHGIVVDVDQTKKQISILHFYVINEGDGGSFRSLGSNFPSGGRKDDNVRRPNNVEVGSGLRQRDKNKKGTLMKETEDWTIALKKWNKVEYGVIESS